MKRLAAVGMVLAMLCGCVTAVNAAAGNVLFDIGQEIKAYDKTTGEEITGALPSGTKIGTATNKATWGTSNPTKLEASVVSDEVGAEGDAFKVHYTAKVGGDTQESIRFDNVLAEYDGITPENPLVIEYRMKAVFEKTTGMNAWIDIVPVLKPETGATVEKTAFVQQSLNIANSGKWIDVKYVITKVADEDNDGKAEFHFERYLDDVLSTGLTSPLVMSEDTANMKIIGIKLRPRARATTYEDGGYMDIVFDRIRLYQPGSKWGDDLIVNSVHNHENLPTKTIIRDKNSFNAYTLSSNGAEYVNQISEDNSVLSVTNQSGADNYQSGLLPVSPRTYTVEDLAGNRALVYETRYKIDYERDDSGNTSYSAVQMLIEFYRNESQSLQFFVPANTKESGEWLNVKVVIPQSTLKGEKQPLLYVDNQPIDFSGTLDGITQVKLRRVMFANRVRSGQTVGEERSAATFTVDYLDEYILQEDGELSVATETIADGDENVAVNLDKLSFTANHLLDKSEPDVTLSKSDGKGGFEEIPSEGAYTVRLSSDKSFDVVLAQPLEEESQYRIELSAKDIYGNAAQGTYTFTTQKNYEWKQAQWSGGTGVLKAVVSNHSFAEISGRLYAAVAEEDSVTQVLSQPLAVAAGQDGDCEFGFEGVSAEAKVRLFYWDANLCPILNTIEVVEGE